MSSSTKTRERVTVRSTDTHRPDYGRRSGGASSQPVRRSVFFPPSARSPHTCEEDHICLEPAVIAN